jgi:NADPH:quinone reductase-like Zn-dependent oxidoreductase
MKSIAIKSGYGLHNISLTEQQMPAIGDYDVVVKVQAVSLNQLDAMIAKGAFKKPLPHVLGSDASGIVQQLGGKVTLFKNGDRVTTHYIQGWQSGDLQPEFLKTRLGVEVPGIFSEYIVIPESYLVAAPPGLTSEESAAIPLAGVTANRPHPGNRRCLAFRPSICESTWSNGYYHFKLG